MSEPHRAGENVPRLDVAVDEPSFVGFRERFTRPAQQVDGALRRYCSETLDQYIEAHTLE